jgi:predicted alpha/beta-hydrolase family hydrolase
MTHTSRPFGIETDRGRVEGLAYEASAPSGVAIVLGHGAGAGHRSAFMVDMARGLSQRGVDVVTFNFPYTEQRRRVPDRAPVLEQAFGAAMAAAAREFPDRAVAIGGKSLGGRMASHVAAALPPDVPVPHALVLLGYPLHPPGQRDRLRVAHLASIRIPTLVVQGERDPFGTPGELSPYFAQLHPPATVHVVPGGDHSFKPPRGGPALAQLLEEVQDRVAEFLRERR